jgi:carbonic anhydrase
MGLPLFEGAMPQQAPFAAVLGCSDARVPTESVFDQSFNQLFVLRIAGNVLGAECLGSLHYAVRHLGESLKVVVVLGHSKCGAVTAAVDAYLAPTDFGDIAFSYPLRSLVDQIQISVRAAARAFEKHEGPEIKNNADYRSLLVAAAVYLNAAVSAFELRRELHLHGGGPEVVFGMYDLETLRVQSSPSDLTRDEARLRPAPLDSNQLSAYAAEVVDELMSLDDEARDRNCKLTAKW